MFINNFDPVAFQIMSFEIRWYSLAFILGIIFGWLLCKKIFIQKSDISEKFDDFVTYLIIGIIVGGRLGYVIFTILIITYLIFLIFLNFGKVVCLFMVGY